MNKILRSLIYLAIHPLRATKIMNLYAFLHGKYKYVTILSHAYIESFYKNKPAAMTAMSTNVNNCCRGGDMADNQIIIINIHNNLLHSGGLTDRLKGICTLYMFAKKQNLNFKIYFVHPFNLEKYLLANVHDWTIDEKQISYNLKTTAIYTWENEKAAKDFFRKNRNKRQLHIGCNSRECFDDYSKLFNELFKPSPFLLNNLKPHIEMLGGAGNYVSISFRFQNLLGEFVEGGSTALDNEEQKELIDKCLNAINNIKQQYADIEKILITSDSNVFREIATYTYTLPDEVGHIDYAGAGKSKELTAFLDMFLISIAKKAYQVRTAEMYNSDFPCMAAKMGNVPYEMILLK
jgi:hypothetical protein